MRFAAYADISLRKAENCHPPFARHQTHVGVRIHRKLPRCRMSKILVADDSKVIQRVMQHVLTVAGFEVALAANGKEALAWLAKEQPDLVISDINMPDRTGYDICNFVRSQAALSDIPVLLITGVVNEEVSRKAKACQADGVLKKPFDESLLKSRVTELLARRGPQPAGRMVAPPMTKSPASTTAPAEARSGRVGPPKPTSPVSESRQPNEDVPAQVPQSLPSSPAEPAVSRITEDALQAFQRTVEGMKKLEAALTEERAESARLTQQLALARQDGERARELESLLAEERAKSAQLSQRLQDAERSLADSKARADAMARAMAEITRLAGQP